MVFTTHWQCSLHFLAKVLLRSIHRQRMVRFRTVYLRGKGRLWNQYYICGPLLAALLGHSSIKIIDGQLRVRSAALWCCLRLRYIQYGLAALCIQHGITIKFWWQNARWAVVHQACVRHITCNIISTSVIHWCVGEPASQSSLITTTADRTGRRCADPGTTVLVRRLTLTGHCHLHTITSGCLWIAHTAACLLHRTVWRCSKHKLPFMQYALSKPRVSTRFVYPECSHIDTILNVLPTRFEKLGSISIRTKERTTANATTTSNCLRISTVCWPQEPQPSVCLVMCL